MPCGCKKGSGMSFRGGGMQIRGGGVRKRKKRKRKGGALIGADPRTWAPKGGGWISAVRNRVRQRPMMVGVRAGMAAFRQARGKRGSGMGFSGAGMSFRGGGLRSGRLFLRRGTGRRLI